jgi:hypothetical protein
MAGVAPIRSMDQLDLLDRTDDERETFAASSRRNRLVRRRSFDKRLTRPRVSAVPGAGD